jgi:hypothetical protein
MYIKKLPNTTRNDLLVVFKATSFDPAMGPSSGDEQELKK